MERKQVSFDGYLNKDDAILPKGWYREAHNILKGTSESGGDKALKKMNSFSVASDIAGVDEFLASTVDSNNNLFVLYKEGATYARIVKIEPDDTLTNIVRYDHGSCTVADPELVVIGNLLAWNYYGDGTPLCWYPDRSYNFAASLEEISLIKQPPRDLSLSINTTNPKDNFAENTYEIACRYVYDSGEVSVLSPWKTVLAERDSSDLNNGIVGIESVDVTLTNTHPEYSSEIEFYARANRGTWRRIATEDVPAIKSDNVTITFEGQMYEALDTESSTKAFDSVPISALTVEAIKNRLFLGNIKDDLGGSKPNITFTPDPNTSSDDFGANSYNEPDEKEYAVNYFKFGEGRSGGKFAVESDDPDSSPSYERKAMINDSSRLVGIQFYDKYLRTRGVEDYVRFKTGMFDFPYRLDRLGIAATNIPSWAEYFQIVYTDNLDKDFSIEGYASNVMYAEENDEGSLAYRLFVSENTKYIVVQTDVAYNYNEGDRINLNLSKSEFSGFPTVSNFKISGTLGDKILCEYDSDYGSIGLHGYYNYFEIYSPKDPVENPVFKEEGTLHLTSSLSGATTYFGTSSIYEATILKRRYTLKKSRYLEASNLDYIDINGVGLHPKDDTTFVSLSEGDSDQQKISPIDAGAGADAIEREVKFDGVLESYNMSLNSGDGELVITWPRYYPKKQPSDSYWYAASIKDSDPSDVIISARINLLTEAGYVGEPFSEIYVDVVWERFNSSDISQELHYDRLWSGGYENVPYTLSYKSEKTLGATNGDYWLVYIRIANYFTTETSQAYELIVGRGTTLSVASAEEYNNANFIHNESHFYGLARTANKKGNYHSWDRPSGKPSVEWSGKTPKTLSNKFRWGGKYILNAEINPISSFYFADQDEVGFESGAITSLTRTSKLTELGTVLLAICERETNSIYVDERIVTNNDGSQQILASDDVVGSIQPLKGSFGSQHRRSITAADGRVVFWDNRRKDWIRYSREGLVPLGEIYKMKSEFASKDSGAVSFYDPFHDIFFLHFTSDIHSYAFKDKRGFESYFDFIPELGGGYMDNKAYLFNGTKVFRTFGSGYNAFDGESVASKIKLGFVTILPIQMEALSLKSEQYLDWTQTGYVKSGVFSIDVTNENGQKTSVPSEYFTFDNGLLYADIMLDENSSGGKEGGVPLVGTNHGLEITLKDNSIDDSVEYLLLTFSKMIGS